MSRRRPAIRGSHCRWWLGGDGRGACARQRARAARGRADRGDENGLARPHPPRVLGVGVEVGGNSRGVPRHWPSQPRAPPPPPPTDTVALIVCRLGWTRRPSGSASVRVVGWVGAGMAAEARHGSRQARRGVCVPVWRRRGGGARRPAREGLACVGGGATGATAPPRLGVVYWPHSEGVLATLGRRVWGKKGGVAVHTSADRGGHRNVSPRQPQWDVQAAAVTRSRGDERASDRVIRRRVARQSAARPPSAKPFAPRGDGRLGRQRTNKDRSNCVERREGWCTSARHQAPSGQKGSHGAILVSMVWAPWWARGGRFPPRHS